MNNSFITKPCSNCGCEHDFPAVCKHDDEIVCECGNLIFPSDYGLCERGFKIVKQLHPPGAN